MIHDGILIPLLLLAPNLLYLFRRKERSVDIQEPRIPRVVQVLEHLGRALALLPPVGLSLKTVYQSPTVVAGLALLAYLGYLICWIRWWRRGRDQRWLGMPLWGIPLPMALFPLLFLALVALMLPSVLILAGLVIFAPTHVWISWRTLL